MKKSYLFLTLITLLIPSFVFSVEKASSSISPGVYIISKGAWGTLKVKQDGSFKIDTMGGNAHICTVSGLIHGNTGYSDYHGCEIFFKQATERQIELIPSPYEKCREYCGARAYFEGLYKKPPNSCSKKNQQKRHNDFLESYKSRRFDEAIERISSLIKECNEFMYWIELDKARNDLALAQYHSGDPATCLKTLEVTRAGNFSKKTDYWMPPTDHDGYIKVAEAIWHNSQLCEKAITSK